MDTAIAPQPAATAPPPHCATCAHFSLPVNDPKAPLGFGRCDLHPVGQYVSPAVRFLCRFSPSRWRAAQ